jgi:hypothetical protein
MSPLREGITHFEILADFSKRLFVHLRNKAAAFEMTCVRNVMYVFLRRWKKFFYLLVMWYELLYCQEISWYNVLKFILLVQMPVSIKAMTFFSK